MRLREFQALICTRCGLFMKPLECKECNLGFLLWKEYSEHKYVVHRECIVIG